MTHFLFAELLKHNHRVPVAALSIGTGKAVQDSRFRDIEVRQPEH